MFAALDRAKAALPRELNSAIHCALSMSRCTTALPSGCSSWFPLGNAAELVAQAKQAGGKLELTVNEVPLLLVLASNGHPTGVLQARCSHYGAPLANGVVCEGRVLCPWHAAAFDSATGKYFLQNQMQQG